MTSAPYHVVPPVGERQLVEAWAGYPLQFEGQRRFQWQDEMASELKASLAAIAASSSTQTLSGTYMTSDPARCDTENRLFTNPGSSSFPRGIRSIRFERGIGDPPNAPVPISRVTEHLHYYRYDLRDGFDSWERLEPIARWSRVPRRGAGDGSCRPVWLAMRQAAEGAVEVFRDLPDTEPFGIRIVVHATAQGPRSAAVISETFVDGVIAAFHGPPPNAPAVAAALLSRLRAVAPGDVEQLVDLRWDGNLFAKSPFNVTPTYVQISPCDERCVAGDVTIVNDSRGRSVEISGELFRLRPIQ
jgi:hypothetical protein